MRLELTADLAQVAIARRFVRANLHDVPAGICADAQLITSELVTNAVEHGVGRSVVLALSRNSKSVDLSVESIGPSDEVGEVTEWKVADAEAITGRGLGIIRKVASDVKVSQSPNRLVITANLAL